MKDIKKVLLCGMGAVGSIYADKFLDFDRENFRVLLDKNRLKSYRENPITFNGKTLEPEYILPDNSDYKADLIIIATKYFNLKEAIENIKNFVKQDTIIMSLLNGITSEDEIAHSYGYDKILYSYFIGHSAMRNGRNIVQDGVNKIVFGSVDNTENVESVKNLFDKVHINYEVPDDIMYSMWLKYMLNVSSNQVSAILGYTFGDMLSNEKCMDLIINIMKEVQAIAKVRGVKNTDKMIDDALSAINTMSKDGRTSMLQDIQAKRKSEVDMFAGTIIKLGKQYNVSTPYNVVLKSLIETIENSF